MEAITSGVRTISSTRFLFLVLAGVLSASVVSAAKPDAKEMLGHWEYLTYIDRISDVPTYGMFLDDNPSDVGNPRFRLRLVCVAGKQQSLTIAIVKKDGEFLLEPTTASVDARVDKQQPLHQQWAVFAFLAVQKDAKLSRSLSTSMLTGRSLFLRVKPNEGFQFETEFNLDGYAEAFARLSSDCRLDR